MEPVARFDNRSIEEAPPDPRLTEIGGWLLVFCLLNVFISPALIAIETFSKDYSGFSYADVINVEFAAVSFVTGIAVWAGVGNARVAFIVLRLYFLVLMLGPSIGALILSQLGTEYNEFRAATFQNWGYAICWFLYFSRSERVQHTFGENLTLWPWSIDTRAGFLGLFVTSFLFLGVVLYLLANVASTPHPNFGLMIARFVVIAFFIPFLRRR